MGETIGRGDNPYWTASQTAQLVGEIRGLRVALEEEVPAEKKEEKKENPKRRRPPIKKEKK